MSEVVLTPEMTQKIDAWCDWVIGDIYNDPSNPQVVINSTLHYRVQLERDLGVWLTKPISDYVRTRITDTMSGNYPDDFVTLCATHASLVRIPPNKQGTRLPVVTWDERMYEKYAAATEAQGNEPIPWIRAKITYDMGSRQKNAVQHLVQRLQTFEKAGTLTSEVVDSETYLFVRFLGSDYANWREIIADFAKLCPATLSEEGASLCIPIFTNIIAEKEDLEAVETKQRKNDFFWSAVKHQFRQTVTGHPLDPVIWKKIAGSHPPDVTGPFWKDRLGGFEGYPSPTEDLRALFVDLARHDDEVEAETWMEIASLLTQRDGDV